MNEIADIKFVEIVGQMLEFLTPKMLAKDLNNFSISEQLISDWFDGKNLPIGKKRFAIYESMRTNSIWDQV